MSLFFIPRCIKIKTLTLKTTLFLYEKNSCFLGNISQTFKSKKKISCHLLPLAALWKHTQAWSPASSGSADDRTDKGTGLSLCCSGSHLWIFFLIRGKSKTSAHLPPAPATSKAQFSKEQPWYLLHSLATRHHNSSALVLHLPQLFGLLLTLQISPNLRF